MEENSFKNVSMTKGYKKNHIKTIIVPFLSGVVGAGLVIATCFGIPQIKEKILDNNSQVSQNVQSGTNSNTTLGTPTQINATAISLEGYSETAMGVADKVLPSIVGIEIEYTVNSFFGKSSSTATGSGIIISEDGYILTNNHVVSASAGTSSSSYYEVTDAGAIKVKLYNDETVYDAKLIGKDDKTDLAVIKIEKTGLTKATLGESNNVRVGEFAMAVGCPLGLNTTVTSGIISAVNREITTTDGEKYVTIQTDAAINSGNSGGALVNSKGEVIGINTLKLSGTGVEGMGFAIPISSTTGIVSQLIEHNKVIRPYVGITGIELDKDMAEKYKLVEGVYIRIVEDFTGAQKAGLKPGDVIVQLDGKEIKTVDDINEIKESHNIGDKLKVRIYRDKDYKELELTLEEEP